jgi:pullulanase
MVRLRSRLAFLAAALVLVVMGMPALLSAQTGEASEVRLPVDAQAHWLSQDILAWNAPAQARVVLRTGADGAPEGHALVRAGTVAGALASANPHLSGMAQWRIPDATRALVRDWLKGRVDLVALDAAGRQIAATRPQIGAVLDELYANDAALGARFGVDGLNIALWAPTARAVRLHLFDSAASKDSVVHPMTEDPRTGVWQVKGQANWNRKYYVYEVAVFVPETGRVEINRTTDPYALSLSADSERSQIVNLDDADLKPAGWDGLRRALSAAPEDRVLYELHIRDFSIGDQSVPTALRGRYSAFGHRAGRGMRHLRGLAAAGLSDVHLLPSYDCATIPERRADQQEPGDLRAFPPNSEAQQAAIAAIKDRDGFNWCYDPWHYMTPEGSYSSDPDGTARIVEFRTMVQSLAQAGLGTVLDVVFNHSMASGQDRQSVLDRIVPGYYHRLDRTGKVERSTCCANTATERRMMERLMLDALLVWARDYKVAGFRFDLMGHHSRQNILNARAALDRLRLEADGVDGANLYIYGEGWNFGEVAGDARFVQATQKNMGQGTGIGTFNDRIRDAIRGGGVGDKGERSVINQGFASGLYTAPNALNGATPENRTKALVAADQIRAALAGSLSRYPLRTAGGQTITAHELSYNGSPFGYASDPQETINYAEAHDNQTLYDSGALKLPRETRPADRVRWQNLASAIVLLSQGVPFLHAGQELLRSKSLDHNSFNSGDWFNRLDFTMRDNGWGRGLPPQADNQADWPIARTLLADPQLRMGRSEIRRAEAHVREFLEIRKSSPLLRLRTADEIIANVRFLADGPEQTPGLIVMALGPATDADMVVVINATRSAQSPSAPANGAYRLHPVLARSSDPVVRRARHDKGRFAVPPLTIAVFVRSDMRGVVAGSIATQQ